MIEAIINTNSTEESNCFLRKLWSELDKIKENGWLYQPYKVSNENLIYIGCCNFGEVKVSYKKKGCIYKLFIDNDTDIEEIKKAIECARRINEIEEYYIGIGYALDKNCRLKLSPNSSSDIFINNTDEESVIWFKMKAYSKKDLKYQLAKKIDTISALLSVFTLQLYDKHKFYITNKKEFEQNCINKNFIYTYDWYDADEVPLDDCSNILLPEHWFSFMKLIIEEDNLVDGLDLLQNACNQYYWASIMKRDSLSNSQYFRNGYIDIFNTIMFSALEPLAVYWDSSVEHCSSCGNLKYSIVKKVKNLLTKYFGETFAGTHGNEYYSYRSKFLHEGKTRTTEQKSNTCWPQLDVNFPNKMAQVQTMPDFNMFDWVAFVIRCTIRDALNRNEDVIFV